MSALKRIYRGIPIVHEIVQIRDALLELRSDASRQRATGLVRFFDFDLPQHPRYGDPGRLHRHALQVCSQGGEDGMIAEIFRRIATADRFFVEVGVGDGTENNTAFLLAQGWRGAWIDADATFVNTVRNRKDLQDGSIRTLPALVSRENIAGLFAQLQVPEKFDLLSLDIDQNTYYAWEGLQAFKPRVVVVEYNATFPPSLDWKVHYDPSRIAQGTVNFGASLKAFELLGRRLGYSLVGCDFLGVNAFFVRADLAAGKFVEPFTAENHYEPPRYALLHRRGHLPAIPDRIGPPD